MVISGGTIGTNFAAFTGSDVTIAGGQIGDAFLASSGSLIDLAGQSFELRDIETGALVQDLTPLLQAGTPFPLTDRDVALTGVLADGTSLEFGLYSVFGAQQDFFAAAANLRLNLALTAIPSKLDIFRGVVVSGGLSEIQEPDDARAIYNPGFTLNDGEAPVWLVLNGNLLVPSASAFLVSLESQASTPGITGSIDAWNFTTSAFDTVQTFSESFNTDTIESANLTASMSDYVQPGTNAVRARVGWRQTGFTLLFPWEARVDQFGWTIH